MERDERSLKLMTVLMRAMHSLEQAVQADIERYGLNTTEFGTLEVLYHKGDLPIQTVCDKMLMANSSMTYVVDKLEKRHLITRRRDLVDRRVTLIGLTEAGKTFFESIFPSHVDTLNTIFKDLTEQQQTKLITFVKRFGHQAKKMVDES